MGGGRPQHAGQPYLLRRRTGASGPPIAGSVDPIVPRPKAPAMRSRILVLAGVATALAAVPSVASAATVTTTRACYLNDGSATLAAVDATGFTPGAPLTVFVDGVAAGSATADATGSARGTIPVPELSSDVAEKEHDVTLNDGTTSASARFSTTRIRGDFSPSSGNPATLKVSFSAFGMNLLKPSTVYVHYVKPNGKLKQTISLGKAKGACGHIPSTKKRKLFGFQAERGRWILQYDTSRKYKKGNDKTPYPWATVSVKIKRIFVR